MSRPGFVLSRRAVLRGMGTAVALPALEAMLPPAARADVPPRRLVFWFVPNGFGPQSQFPSSGTSTAVLPTFMSPLEPLKSDFNIIAGLDHNEDDQTAGDHSRQTSSFLAQVKVDRSQVRIGKTVDQVAGDFLAGKTKFKSLELGMENISVSGSICDSVPCPYKRYMSWSTPTTPVPKEISPAKVFDRLFGSGTTPADVDKLGGLRATLKKSILDFANADANRLKARLGRSDKAKLDEYLTSVRDVETRIQSTPSPAVSCSPSGRPPDGDLPARLGQMLDLMVLALRCDLTRIITLMRGDVFSGLDFGFLGLGDDHHGISHYGENGSAAGLAKINTWDLQGLANFLTKLKTTPDVSGTLLDNTLVHWSTDVADGQSHSRNGVPVILGGRGGGVVTTGRRIVAPAKGWTDPSGHSAPGTPLANLYVAMLQNIGVPGTQLGNSTGALAL